MLQTLSKANSQEAHITRFGVLSPLGCDEKTFLNSLVEGRCGIVKVAGLQVPKTFPIHFAGLLSENNLRLPHLSDNNYESEVRVFLSNLVEQTFSQQQNITPLDVAFLGCNDNGLAWESAIDCDPKRELQDCVRNKMIDSCQILHSILLEKEIPLAKDFSVVGVYNTCITGNVLLGMAKQWIECGRAQSALVSCVEQRIRPLLLLPFHLLGALSVEKENVAKACCPFSANRNGFVKAEGGAMVLVESNSSMQSSLQNSVARISGYSQNSDAYHMTDSHPEQRGAVNAMTLAMKEAGVESRQIDYINAHGTSTRLNDFAETQAVHRVFGERPHCPPMSSLKSQMGHTNIASSLIEAVACALMLKHQFMAPTIHYGDPDPDCDLNYVPNKSAAAPLSVVMSNSFGFGGLNSSIIFEKPLREGF